MKFYLSILLCLVCLSCANQADQYIIRGSFPGLQDGMTVRLLNAETRNKDEQLLAADTVKNGRFELTGSVDAPVMCHLWISNKDIVSNKKQSRSLGTRLFLDHSAIKIRTPHFDSLYYISEYGPDDRELLTEVVGGTLQKDYMDYRQTVHANELEYSKYNSILSTLNWDRMATPDKYTPEEYHRLYTESYRLRKEAAERLHADRMAFIRSHRQSPLALYVANEMISKSFSVPATDLEELPYQRHRPCSPFLPASRTGLLFLQGYPLSGCSAPYTHFRYHPPIRTHPPGTCHADRLLGFMVRSLPCRHPQGESPLRQVRARPVRCDQHLARFEKRRLAKSPRRGKNALATIHRRQQRI